MLNVCLFVTIILKERGSMSYPGSLCLYVFLSLSLCVCVCVCRGGGVVMQHSFSLRRARPHIPADVTVSDRTSPFSTILPPSLQRTLPSRCPWLNSGQRGSAVHPSRPSSWCWSSPLLVCPTSLANLSLWCRPTHILPPSRLSTTALAGCYGTSLSRH